MPRKCGPQLSSPEGILLSVPSHCRQMLAVAGFSVLLRSRAFLSPPSSFLSRRPRSLAASSSSLPPSPHEMEASYKFGPYKIDAREVFHATPLSYAMVNLRPLVPGHVLVCPKREVKRFADLSSDETSDLWITAKEVGAQLEQYHKASSLTFAIQDGPQAGQTVPHSTFTLSQGRQGILRKMMKYMM